MSRLKTIQWLNNSAVIIDQTRLPVDLVYEPVSTVEEMYAAIKILKVRGAPAIGIAGAFGAYLGIMNLPNNTNPKELLAVFKEKAEYLSSSRPTAVNLSWAIDRMTGLAEELVNKEFSIVEIKQKLLNEAHFILDEDRAMCRKIGEHGVSLLDRKRAILTHCNAGGLATSEYGTALAPVYVAAERGRLIHVFADETRPLLQGSRITAFELKKAGIPVTVICDNMAATVMARKMVDAVIVGADRIAANGDTANKIGTYGVAILARAHGIPFYVAAPGSTFDLTVSKGEEIPIEERDPIEITCGFGRQTAPSGVDVFNPAFDVTPSELIAAFITDKGIIRPPYSLSLKTVFGL